MSILWGFDDLSKAYSVTDNIPFYESGLLKLNCDKALMELKWESNLNYAETVKFVGEWYKKYYEKNEDLYLFTEEQIKNYENLAEKRKRVWVNEG